MRKAQVLNSTRLPTTPQKRDRHGFRGIPPPASFSLAELPDDAQLTEGEVAAVGRWSTNTVANWRRHPGHPLEWEYVAGGFIRYRAGKVRTFMATPYKRRVHGPPKRCADQPALPAEYKKGGTTDARKDERSCGHDKASQRSGGSARPPSGRARRHEDDPVTSRS